MTDNVSPHTPLFSSDNDFSGITTDMPTIIATNAPPPESAGAKEDKATSYRTARVHLDAPVSMPEPVASGADLRSINLEGMYDAEEGEDEDAGPSGAMPSLSQGAYALGQVTVDAQGNVKGLA